MPGLVTAVFGLAVIGYVAAASRLDRWNVTAPIVFTAAGTVIGVWFWPGTDPTIVHGIAEITLAMILFHDAAQVRPRQIRSEAGACARLLLIGLPLTIVFGVVTAGWLMPGIGIWLALLVAAALAPTDAGLGAPTVLNPIVPVRVRRVLNVESGLNDGLSTPVVLFAIAAASGSLDGSGHTVVEALLELAGGVLVGVLLGAGSGRLLARAQRAGTPTELLTIATLAVPVAAYYGSIPAHSNGFVAAFVAGTAFAAGFTRPTDREPVVPADAAERPLLLTAWLSTALSYAVWGLFGVIGVARLFVLVNWSAVVYAVLSLTVLRMLPVALALIGTGFRLPTVAFIGWFGPRGLASVIFALIAVEELDVTDETRAVIGTITVTVLLSVIAHGVTAGPGATRYGRWVQQTRPIEELRTSATPSGGRAGPHARHLDGSPS